MKTYRIKKIYADSLIGLHGLYMTPSECWYCVNINVFDHQTANSFSACPDLLTHLPKSCDSGLVHTVLKQAQFDKNTSEQLKRLKEYLKLAQQKDKNDEIKFDLGDSIRQFFFGFLVIAVGGVGIALMLLLIGLSPANSGWIALLFIIPVLVCTTHGFIKLSISYLKLGMGIFLSCFRKKNVRRLTELENELHFFCSQVLPPPSYTDVMASSSSTVSLSAPEWDVEPPTYEEAIRLAHMVTAPASVPMSLSASALLGSHSTHFFHQAHFVSSNSLINDNPSSLTSQHGFSKTIAAQH